MLRNALNSREDDYDSNGSSGSDSDTEVANFKRSKRAKRNRDQTVDEVDLRKCSNGRKDIPAVPEPEVIVHKKIEPEANVKQEEVNKILPTTVKPKENGGVAYRGGISFTSSATEIMRQMGFDSNVGLGKFMNDCELSSTKLEHMENYLNKQGIVIDDNAVDLEEELVIEEEIRWIPPTLADHIPRDPQNLRSWRKLGPRKISIKQEIDFIDPTVLDQVCILRKCFEGYNDYEYQQLRARSYPFESLGKGPFICRAGLKLANLDAATSYALTQPTTHSGDKQSVLGPNDLFYFADICAGPGGFTEYILSRKKWTAKGFGMTLKGKLDFDPGSFFHGSPESFEPFYGPENDGDVCNPRNARAFMNLVLSSTEGRGVHLLTADGGFEVEDKELTEIVSAQLYLAQCYLALALVRQGGMFVCKFFDTLTPFSVGLIYLMYLSFDLVAIHKPKTSRPANSERYLVCKWKRDGIEGIRQYLADNYELFWECSKGQGREDIIELVPMDVLNKNKDFFEYIVRSNTVIARQQVAYMKRMVTFARDPNLVDRRRENLARKCLELWKLPTNPSKIPPVGNNVEKFFQNLAGPQPTEFLGCQEFPLTEHNLEAFIRSPYDWRVVVIEANNQNEKTRGFYLSLGRNRIYRYDGKSWVHIQEKLELCKETLVYGEFVEEFYSKRPSQKVKAFHIIDAMVLGGTDVRAFHYTTRHEVCMKFAKAMNKPSHRELCQVRAKIPVRLENIADIFEKLENRVFSGNGVSSQLICPVDHTDETLPFIRPAGILFIKITKDPWTMALSRSSNRKYYFNLSTGVSNYDLVPESISSFHYTMQNRVIWWWDKDLKNILATQEVTADSRPITVTGGTLNPQTLLRFVQGEWQMNRTAMRRLSSSSSNHSSS